MAALITGQTRNSFPNVSSSAVQASLEHLPTVGFGNRFGQIEGLIHCQEGRFHLLTTILYLAMLV